MTADKMKKLKDISEIVTDIPSLPVVATKILQVISNEDSSLKELIKVISLDQSFSSRLLRIANSAFYRRDSSVTDVTDAVIRIGFTATKAFVFAASLKDILRTSNKTDKALWEHNMAVSIGATIIANETALMPSGEPLIYGLLHDIGKVVINLNMRDQYAEVIRMVNEQNIPFNEAEYQLLGFDHCDVGDFVAKQWHLPENLSFVIANHHREDLLEKIKDLPLKKIILITKAADVLCSDLGIGLAHPKTLAKNEWDALKLPSQKKRDKVMQKIEKEYPEFRNFITGQGVV
jgi:HD-like signal output (HDOD) protein